MKTSVNLLPMKHFITFLVFTFIQTIIWAQEGGGSESSSTTSTTKVRVAEETSNWYASPWVWVIGAAIFILLLVALLRGGGSDRTATRTDRVTYKEKVVRDSDSDNV